MRKFREGISRDQLSFLPASIDEYVSSDDSVRYVDALVDELDLTSIEAQYSPIGRRAYAPKMLVKLLVYGKMRGIRSSRELSRATKENIRFIFLCSNEHPDFRTVSDFRKRFHRELSGLLAQTIRIGLVEGIITLEDVAIDGTKLRASAASKSFSTPEHLEKLLQTLEQSFQEDIENDSHQDENGDDDEPTLPPELRNKKALREKISAALEHYQFIDKEKPKQISVTDPECRFAKGLGQQVVPVYNGQAAVDAESRMVVAGYLTNAVSDNAELVPVLEQIEENTGRNPKRICADKGYSQGIGFHDLVRRNIDGYVPQREGFVSSQQTKTIRHRDFFYYPKKDFIVCPEREKLTFEKYQESFQTRKRLSSVYSTSACKNCLIAKSCPRDRADFQYQMSSRINRWHATSLNEKTRTPMGVAMRKLRSSVVEPLFGHIKAARKFRQCAFRGMKMLDAMWKLELAAYNIDKLARHRMA